MHTKKNQRPGLKGRAKAQEDIKLMQHINLYDSYTGKDTYCFYGQKIKQFESGSLYMSHKGEFYETLKHGELTKVIHYTDLSELRQAVGVSVLDEICSEYEL